MVGFPGTLWDGARAYKHGVSSIPGLAWIVMESEWMILAHNHPSGIAEPSQADELITQRVKEALGLVDIRLLDHIIVGDGASVSLAERGLV
jgi:DNA repair protein RadC